MARTNQTLVGEILGSNWDQETSLTPYIDKATLIINRLIPAAAQRQITISSDEAEMIERWLAAYNYTIMDALYKARSTQGASGSFVRSDKNDYLQGAVQSDPSGMLNSLLIPARAFGGWLGKVPGDQLDADDRTSI